MVIALFQMHAFITPPLDTRIIIIRRVLTNNNDILFIFKLFAVKIVTRSGLEVSKI
jgi:hypothetical protein